MKTYTINGVQVAAQQLKDSDFDGKHPNEDHIPTVMYDPKERLAKWMYIRTPIQNWGEVGDWMIKHPIENNYILTDKEFKEIAMGIEDSMFECEVCTHVMDKSEMSPTQNVCEVCEAKCDRGESHQT